MIKAKLNSFSFQSNLRPKVDNAGVKMHYRSAHTVYVYENNCEYDSL